MLNMSVIARRAQLVIRRVIWLCVVVWMLYGIYVLCVVGADRPDFGTYGPLVPTKRPSVENRVYHPDGFSIIRPEGWDVKINGRHSQGMPSICIQSRYPFYYKPSSWNRLSVILVEKRGADWDPRGMDGEVREIVSNGVVWNVRRTIHKYQEGRSLVEFVLTATISGTSIIVGYWPGDQDEVIPKMMFEYFATIEAADVRG